MTLDPHSKLLASCFFAIMLLIIGDLSCSTALAASESDNIALSKLATSTEMDTPLHAITDGVFAVEGDRWDSPLSARSKKDSIGNVVIDLGAIFPLKALIIQADWNDAYIIDTSLDGQTWQRLWIAPKIGFRAGLRTRSIILPEELLKRYLRIRGVNGDGVLSIAEFQAYSSLPRNWDQISNPSGGEDPYAWFPALTFSRVDRIKSILLFFGFGLLVWQITAPSLALRFRQALLTIVTILSFCAWSNFFQFHYATAVHRHEFFHYFLGSKYYPELSYTRLYLCTVIADSEDRFIAPDSTLQVRNLETNIRGDIKSILANPKMCKEHFSESRWQSFKKDVAFFRQEMPRDEYDRMLSDHGYNATPVWSISGRLLSSISNATVEFVSALGLLDTILVTLMWIIVVRTFGFEVAAYALIFWACNYIARFSWTGNGLLRSDWLVASVIGICALKSKRLVASGMLLAYAGLTRIFPFAFLGSIFVRDCCLSLYQKNLSSFRAHLKLYASAFILSVALMICATINAGGTRVWSEFQANTKKHFDTISTNMMGLKILASSDSEGFSDALSDPSLPDTFEPWREHRRDVLAHRMPIYITICLFIFASLALSSIYEEAWESAVRAAAIITIINLSNYDYYFLLLYALLLPKRIYPVLGLIIVGFLTWQIALMFGDADRGFIAQSILVMGFVIIELTSRLIHIKKHNIHPISCE